MTASQDRNKDKKDAVQDVPKASSEGAEEALAQPQQVEYRFHSPQLSLAVYQEVAAHLRQIEGVRTGLLPQTSKEFDYLQSQVGGVWVRYNADDASTCQPQIEAILTYYGDRYGNWETLSR